MRIRFFDFEVFPDWWCCVFGDLPEGVTKSTDVTEEIKKDFFYVSSDDADCRNKLINALREPGYAVAGYNIKRYDLMIANGIYQGFTPQQIKIINDIIINPSLAYSSKEHIRLQSFAKKRLPNVTFIDLMDDATGSLKEKEAILGLNIMESAVSFDKECINDKEKENVLYYCYQDVYAAMQWYLQVVLPYTTSKLNVGKVFGIPEDVCYRTTNAGLVAMALKAKRRTFEDAEKVQIDLPVRIKEYCYENIPHDILERLLNNNEAFSTRLFNNDVSYGNGGIHSTYGDDLYVESDDEWVLMNVDAGSYYPSILIQLDCLSRAITNPDDFKNIFNERMRIKHLPNKTRWEEDMQLAYKLILNTTFGASGNKWLDLYDPYMCTRTCRVGQIFLTALACKMVRMIPGLKIIQTNTDGILAYFRRKDADKVRKLEEEWTKVSGINMEEDIVDKIWQRNVNNYLLIKDGGKVKRKGGWLNDIIFRYGYVMLSPLSAFVCTKAAADYLVNKTPIIQSIVNNKNIADFAIVCTKGPTYSGVIQRMTDGTEVPLYKCNRVIATKDESYGMIYKYKKYKERISYAKMPSIPEHCKLINDDFANYNFDEVKKELDYQFYLQRTLDLLDIPWQQLSGDNLNRIDKFNPYNDFNI